MGYSIYIIDFTPEEKETLQKVEAIWKDNLSNDSYFKDKVPNGLFGYNDDLSYVAEKYEKLDSVCGLNYGEPDSSRAMLMALCRATNRHFYYHDSMGEKCKVEKENWWERPKEKWTKYQSLLWKEFGPFFKSLSVDTHLFENIWKNINNPNKLQIIRIIATCNELKRLEKLKYQRHITGVKKSKLHLRKKIIGLALQLQLEDGV